MDFPVDAKPNGREYVEVSGPGFSFTLCAHGARELARLLLMAANRQYCDGYLHGDDSTMFVSNNVVPATDLASLKEDQRIVVVTDR